MSQASISRRSDRRRTRQLERHCNTGGLTLVAVPGGSARRLHVFNMFAAAPVLGVAECFAGPDRHDSCEVCKNVQD